MANKVQKCERACSCACSHISVRWHGLLLPRALYHRVPPARVLKPGSRDGDGPGKHGGNRGVHILFQEVEDWVPPSVAQIVMW